MSNTDEFTAATGSKDEKYMSFAVRYYGARHTQALLLALAAAISFATRACLSVAIVAMTTPETSPNEDVPTFEDWTNQSVMLSSYFWGYVSLQIFIGVFIKKYGPKWILVVSQAIGSLFSIVIPFVAPYGSWAVILCRVVQGLCQGLLFPCCHDMLSKWIPANEKSKMNALVYGSGPLGMAISMPLTGLVSATWVGWPYAFYGHGVIGLLWSLVWIIVGKNTPEDHKSMDPEEKRYIEDSVKKVTVLVPTPWKEIVKSLPVWAILIGSWGQVWGFSTLVTNIPRYSASILGYDIEQNGIISALPFLSFWALSMTFSVIADYIITRQIVTIKIARIIMNCIGFYVPGLMLLILGTLSLLDLNAASGITAMFVIGGGMSSAFLCGYNVNSLDIAPAHAGILMGITNGLGNISSILGPLIVQFIVIDEKNATEWAIVFYISAAFYIVSNTFYIIFCSGTIQTWNDNTLHKSKQNDDENKNGDQLTL